MTKHKRPGFFSPIGILLAAILVVVVIALTITLGPVLFSPGPLNAQAKAAPLNGAASHADIGHDCSACHPAPWSSQTMADKCLTCHASVGGEITSRKGLHGTLVGASSPTCGGCHPDHRGPNGALTLLDEATFPHQLMGYSLRTHKKTAQGARFTCADCHPQSYGSFDVAVCADCHAKMDASFMNTHEASFGKDCLPCHDGSGRTTVDHSKFAFKLTGKHAGLQCDACHAGAKSMQDYQQTPQDCYSCHAKDDEHKGSFGKDCGGCHTTNGWSDVTFDHKIFPVDHGQDREQSTCKTCHPATTSQYTCFGCHAHTTANVVSEHEGKSLAQLTDCIECHAGGRGGDD
jgi:hypothetical protein